MVASRGITLYRTARADQSIPSGNQTYCWAIAGLLECHSLEDMMALHALQGYFACTIVHLIIGTRYRLANQQLEYYINNFSYRSWNMHIRKEKYFRKVSKLFWLLFQLCNIALPIVLILGSTLYISCGQAAHRMRRDDIYFHHFTNIDTHFGLITQC